MERGEEDERQPEAQEESALKKLSCSRRQKEAPTSLQLHLLRRRRNLRVQTLHPLVWFQDPAVASDVRSRHPLFHTWRSDAGRDEDAWRANLYVLPSERLSSRYRRSRSPPPSQSQHARRSLDGNHMLPVRGRKRWRGRSEALRRSSAGAPGCWDTAVEEVQKRPLNELSKVHQTRKCCSYDQQSKKKQPINT